MKFLTYTNRGYLKLSENLVRNFQQPFMERHALVLECLDAESLRIASRWSGSNIHPRQTVLNMHPLLCTFAKYDTFMFNALVRYKFILLLHHLTEDVWYLDSDIAIFQDPVALVSEYEDCDWIMQLDEPTPNRRVNWCTGCFRVKCTSASQAFLAGLLRYYAKTSSARDNDQDVFNQFVQTPECDELCLGERFSIRPLDAKLFQNGRNAFDQGWHVTEHPAIVHANYRIGEEAKIEALIACRRWFVEGAHSYAYLRT
jgi:Nucleotide-diphospho-sugar transferase